MTEPALTQEHDRDGVDLLAEEFAARLRRGESPSVEEFAARYPGDPDEIRELLASVGMIEEWKRRKQLARDNPDVGVPEHLGDYRIVREIGRGGMGVVFEAEQTSLGRHVAVKVLPRHSLLDPLRLRRFQREAQAAGRLHHTNIVPIFGVGEHEGLHYIVMQLIDGRGLDRVVGDWKARGPADAPGEGRPRWRRVAHIGAQAADAIDYAHQQGVLHRDVKPANLLLDAHDIVWITDFGLAKIVAQENLSGSGDLIGTLQYMAPERFQTEADARSDVYGLGLTLYELLTLEPAFQESSPSKLIRRVSEGCPVLPRKRNPAIPRDLETVILKAIAREPEHRYQTARALADDLNRYLNDLPVHARRASLVERGARWARRNRAVASLGATAFAALLLAALFGWAGYVGTTRALARESLRRDEAEQATRRADANVALSLEAIESLFDQLTPRDNGKEFTPGRHHLGGPPRSGPSGPPPPDGVWDDRPPPPEPGGFGGGPGPGRGFGPGPGPGPGREFGFGPGPGGPGHGPGGPGGPDGEPRTRDTEAEASMLESVLAFYDKFAAKNATNAKLRHEAAIAQVRVGDLQRRLGRDEAASASYARATASLEALVAAEPNDPDLLYELAATHAMAEPDPPADDPAALARAEKSLRRALALAEPLVETMADSPEPSILLARVHGRLATLLDGMGKTKEAESSLRKAVEYDREPNDSAASSRLPRLMPRQALAEFLAAHDRNADAKAVLLECKRDLDAYSAKAVASGRGPSPSLSDRLQSLATSFRSIGETDLADALSAKARASRSSRSPQSRGPGYGPGPSRPPKGER